MISDGLWVEGGSVMHYQTVSHFYIPFTSKLSDLMESGSLTVHPYKFVNCRLERDESVNDYSVDDVKNWIQSNSTVQLLVERVIKAAEVVRTDFSKDCTEKEE